MQNNYLDSVKKQFLFNKNLGDKSFDQIPEEGIHWQYNEASNSIAIIVKHMAGNMLSRWTNFLTEDGEKEWRKRDEEFEDTYSSKEEMLADWEKGWNCLFDGLNSLKPEDLEAIIYIRNEGHTVIEAINRQLSHYSYHTGQIVYIARMISSDEWQSLSIPKGTSKEYNKEKFGEEKGRRHYTDEYLPSKED
ncbi:DUF1572 domain-containing protein [Leptobacterium flavescens]|uniref:DUF1572 domain-containing protein n=1 Tax=Leptobacterium flavescens TaxID=472055 RepID=A0A6P0UUI2_9FLAO|nr:DUF1572 family protein [Leptobacterium flavescens]NER14076.1 DUF1572 domain-containing protein [Leptobacterium flavescens]